MEILIQFSYPMGHETPWNTATVGDATFVCRKVVEEGAAPVHRCPGRGLLREQRLPVVAVFPKKGREWIAARSGHRTPPEADPGTEAKADAYSLAQCLGRRIRHGPLDPGTNRGGNPAALWGGLSPLPRLEAVARAGLVLPEARDQGAGERRGSDRALEALPVAAYKKKPKDLGAISSFSTRAGSSCFPTSVGPGHLKDRRRFCVVPDTGRRFRLSRPWLYRRTAGGWHSTPVSTPRRTSIPSWPPNSWDTCSKRCGDLSCFFGIAAISTRGRRSGSSSASIRACTPSGSRDILPSSTRRSGFGSCSKSPWPIVRQRICATSRAEFIVPSRGFASPRSCSGPASMLPICHGQDD